MSACLSQAPSDACFYLGMQINKALGAMWQANNLMSLSPACFKSEMKRQELLGGQLERCFAALDALAVRYSALREFLLPIAANIGVIATVLRTYNANNPTERHSIYGKIGEITAQLRKLEQYVGSQICNG